MVPDRFKLRLGGKTLKWAQATGPLLTEFMRLAQRNYRPCILKDEGTIPSGMVEGRKGEGGLIEVRYLAPPTDPTRPTPQWAENIMRTINKIQNKGVTTS